jgi:triphosphoribosyl-dephospho-CoA synthase
MQPSRIEAFVWACTLDVAVPKPGNVSAASPGHGMTAHQFIASARAAAGPLCEPGAAVGRRIEGAVRASRAAAGCNTNLGIVLLCAPVAVASECLAGPASAAALQDMLHRVAQALTVDDARAAYRAIAHANPGGLGRAPDQDVAAEPSMDLRAAMALAADRDRIACQYAQGFDELFKRGLPLFHQGLQQGLAAAVLDTYLGWLASGPDSHILRKHGAALAQTVTAEAAALRREGRTASLLARSHALSSWDTQLKTRGINPGTSADLTVATLFIAACLDPSLVSRSTDEALVA